jgi:hypothetical protein
LPPRTIPSRPLICCSPISRAGWTHAWHWHRRISTQNNGAPLLPRFVRSGRCRRSTPPFATVFAAGARHKWWNAGDDHLEFSGQAIPAVDLDRYLEGVFAVVNASPNGRPSIFYIAHVLWRHRNSQLIATPPQAIQRIVFPFCSSVASWENTVDRAGPVRPSRAQVLRLWTLTPRAALLVAALFFSRVILRWVADIAPGWWASGNYSQSFTFSGGALSALGRVF